MIKKRYFSTALLVTVLGLSGCGYTQSSTDTTNEPEMSNESDMNTGHEVVHFTYSGETGPDYWGELKSDWATCKNGIELTAVVEGTKHQSPVDFDSAVPADANFTLDYTHAMEFKIQNNGHAVQFDVEGEEKASLTLNNKKYTLKQFHFHSLSEHTEHGTHAKLEGHFVNVADDGSLAVVGVFVDENNASLNVALEKAFDLTIPQANEKGATVALDPSVILPTGTVYSYSGSLTTPPCSEGVAWNVYTTHINLSKTKVEAFNAHYTNNYRPITGTY